jgi:hypothetical protein
MWHRVSLQLCTHYDAVDRLAKSLIVLHSLSLPSKVSQFGSIAYKAIRSQAETKVMVTPPRIAVGFEREE